MPFFPHKWPPGRACSPGKYTWEHYPKEADDTPQWVREFDSLLQSFSLTSTNDRRIRATVFTALRRAEEGKLDVVVQSDWSDRRTGHVDRMSLAHNKILEIRLEEIEGKNLLKGKRLRLYFSEPATQEILLALVFAPKDISNGHWKEEQNRAVHRAEALADEWWDQP